MIAPRFRSRLTASVPEGWLLSESIELMSPDEDVSVRGTATLVSPETTLEQYAEQVAAELREHVSGYEELSLETVDVGGHPGNDSKPPLDAGRRQAGQRASDVHGR